MIWSLPVISLMAVGGWVSLLSGCTLRPEPRASAIVILVEDLGFGSFSCGEGAEPIESAGFQAFCDEAVRFTHAYAPSTMSQATAISLLTAMWPFEHGVRHNGPQALSARAETVAEAAINKGYRTIFVSGGPPIFRRSGLSQGFEIFEDNIAFSLRRLYRPAAEVVDLFLQWQEREQLKSGILGFLHFSDLQFLDVPTTNALGELRERSVRSQLEEVGEALTVLVRELKRRKLWDSTDIFLVGLNGLPTNTRYGEAPGLNLFSESTHSTLMIKPSRKRRDGPFNWKIDLNVSLVDVGATLFDLIGEPRKGARSSTFRLAQGVGAPAQLSDGAGSGKLAAVSLVAALRGPTPNWPADRLVISESAWGQWRGAGPIRAAVRQGPYLYLFDKQDQLFNTLTDSLEISPLPFSGATGLPLSFSADPVLKEVRQKFAETLSRLGYERWEPREPSIIQKSLIAPQIWLGREAEAEAEAEAVEALRELAFRFPEDSQLPGWRAIHALRRSDWRELKSASAGRAERAAWTYVAARNLGEAAPLPTDPCFAFLAPEESGLINKNCRSEGVHDLLLWSDVSSPESDRKRAMDNVLRVALTKALEQRAQEFNFANGWKWDTPMASLHGPSTLELILALPEMRRQRNEIRQVILRESRAL